MPPNVFRPHYAGGIYNATIVGHTGIVFEGDSGRGIAPLSRYHRFQQAFRRSSFPPSRRFSFLLFEERFRKAPFS